MVQLSQGEQTVCTVRSDVCTDEPNGVERSVCTVTSKECTEEPGVQHEHIECTASIGQSAANPKASPKKARQQYVF